MCISVLARNLFIRGVHSEMHNVRNLSEACIVRCIILGISVKPYLVKYLKQSNQRAKGWQRAHFVFRPDYNAKGTLEA